jgi:hypothetical protein
VGNCDDALRYADEARTFSRQRGNHRAELHALMTTATALARFGRAEELSAVCEEAAALPDVRQTHASSLTAFGYFDLVRQAQKNGDAMVGQLERDLAAFRELGNWGGEGFALIGLGLSYLRAGNRDKGGSCLRHAEELFSRRRYALGVAIVRGYLEKLGADSREQQSDDSPGRCSSDSGE